MWISQRLCFLFFASIFLISCQFLNPPKPLARQKEEEKEVHQKPNLNVFRDENIMQAQKVAILPLFNATPAQTPLTEYSRVFDNILSEALATKGAFEWVKINPEVLIKHFSQGSFSATGDLPLNLIHFIEQEYHCDALFLQDLTFFFPYQPQKIGLKAKLIALPSGKLLWACDQVFTATDALFQIRASFFKPSKEEVHRQKNIANSPRAFMQSIANVVFSTF